MHLVPSKLAPMEIGELTPVVIVNITCTTMWYSPCDCSTLSYIIIYGLYMPYSHSSLFYCSSVDQHGWLTSSTYPHTIHVSCGLLTRVPYHIAPCRPLWPATGLPSLHQRGVAQEKWSCDRPRSCLTYGLVLLVLPVMWSVHHLSSPDDLIQGLDKDQTWKLGFPPIFQGKPLFPPCFQVSSTWNHPTTNHFLYGGQCHWHAGSRSTSLVHHWNMLFQWIF